MSVTLARTSFYRLSLGDHRMHKLLTAKTREAATEMGLLDRIKDWFCSGKKKNCLNLMFDLLSNIENFKTEQPEKLEELKSLFRYADPRDLITFWHAHDDQGQSLIGRAVLSSDEESKATIKRCLAVLECFPLPLFDSYQLAALVGCANKGDQSRVLGLALKNNNTEAVKTFESLYRDVLTQYQLRYNNAFDETPMLVDCYVYGSHILHDLSCKLITSTTADQLNAVRCCLDLIKPRKSPRLVDEFSSILEPVVQILGDLFKSALLTDDNPVVLDCIASLLSMVDNNTRAAFAKVYLSNNLRSAITEISLQNTTVAKRQNSLNTFNRIASLFQRFQIPVPVSLWGGNPRSAATPMESLLRFALTSQRYESVSLLLKITNNLDSDPSYVKIIASQAAHLLQLSDFNGLKTLLESGSNVVRKIVLDHLEKDKAKAVEMATYLISQRHWGVIDLIISSRPTTEFSKKLQDTINKDDVVLAAMTQDYLNQHQWDKVLDIMSPLPTARKSRLCEAIFRDQTKIAAMFNVRERYFLVSRSFSVLPDDYKEKLIEIILSAPNGSVYLDPTQWSFLTVVSYLKMDDGLKIRLMGKIAAKMNTLPEATQYSCHFPP